LLGEKNTIYSLKSAAEVVQANRTYDARVKSGSVLCAEATQQMRRYYSRGLFRRCWDGFTNSVVEQLYEKLEFIEHLFRCSHNTFLEQSAWS
jgi:hypothetical protein